VHEVARALAIDTALGNSREGQLALWQVIARVIDQASRLSSVRLARSHACAGILDLRGFAEDDLYANLDWLADQQAEVEKKLFEHQQAPQGLFLYASPVVIWKARKMLLAPSVIIATTKEESCKLSLASCVTALDGRWRLRSFWQYPRHQDLCLAS
jgi:hypothetical protein